MALIVSPSQNEIEQMGKLGLDILPHRKRINDSQPPLDEKFKDSMGVTDAEWGHAVKTVSDRQKGSSDPLIRGTEEFRQAVADEINRRITEQRAIGKPVKNEPLSSILRQQSVSGTVRFEVSAAPGTGVSVDGDTSGPIDFVIAGDVGKPSHATGGGL